MFGLRRLSRARQAFESRTEVWREVGLGAEIDRRQATRAKGAVLIELALIAAVLFLFEHRRDVFPGLGEPVRIATVAMLVVLGWGLARALGQSFAPALFRRMDPGMAGSVGFLIRLVTLALVAALALRVAGVNAGALAVGGAFTAVVLGLAAQQTFGNLFAGLVLLTTRPFRVGERVRLVGGALAGQIEGIVGSLGERLAEAIDVPIRYPPHIAVEELDHDEVVVKIVVTPERPADGGRLAGEVLSAVRETDGDQRHGDGAQRRDA